MKKILFLLFFPFLALAQYQGNANQKITLGEQTTADGLVFRGVLNDTALITPLSDTSAYIILDTVNNRFYNYNRSTNVWSVAGGGTAVTSITGGTGLTGGTITSTGTLAADTNFLVTRFDTSSMLTNYYRAGRNTIIQAADVPLLNQNTTGSAATLTTGRTIQTNLASTSAATFNGSANITPGVTGTLPVANGGTGKSSLTANKILVGSGTDTIKSPTNLHWDNTNSRLGIGTSSPTSTLDVRGEISQKGTGNVSNIFESTTNTGRFIQSYSNDVGAAFQQGVFGSNNSQTLFGKTANNIAFIYTTTFVSTHPSVFAIGTFSNQDLILGTNNTQRILIESGGAVTINNLAGTGNRNVIADVNGLLSAPTSSIITKENVQVLNYGLNEILQINPVSFDYIDKNKWGDERNLGFIVEDMYPIIPEVTGTMNNGDMYLDMVKLIPVLTKAIQEQQALIKALEQRIINLENK